LKKIIIKKKIVISFMKFGESIGIVKIKKTGFIKLQDSRKNDIA
jgi:hypothetical protein